MAFQLSARSRQRLVGVHPDLVRVVERAIELTGVDFMVFEGLRSLETQRRYVDKGVSKTLNSRHLTGHAVDLVPLDEGQASWSWPLCHKVAAAVKQAAKECGVAVEWGGDWRSFPDGAHFQLPRKQYPAEPTALPSEVVAAAPADDKPAAPPARPAKAVTTVAAVAAPAASAMGGMLGVAQSPAVQITLILVTVALAVAGLVAWKKGWLS